MTGYTSTTPPSTAASAMSQAPNLSQFDADNTTARRPPSESAEAAAHEAARFAHAHYAESTPNAPTPVKRTFTRILLMAGVFAIGISVGLTAAWWMQRSAPATHAVAARKPAQVAATTSPRKLSEGRPVAVTGISPSELPYDGAPPPPAEQEPKQPQAAAAPAVIAPPDSFAGLSSGDSGTAADDEDVRSSVPDLPDAETQADRTEAAPPPKAAVKASARAKPKPDDEDDGKQAQKRRSMARVAKDREIERIRKEADKELQRKLEVGRAAQEERSSKLQANNASRGNRREAVAMRESREVRVRRVLAQCERVRNIFRREHCKWRLCAGMWGKNGCPSYSRPSNPYHTY